MQVLGNIFFGKLYMCEKSSEFSLFIALEAYTIKTYMYATLLLYS